MRRRAPNLNDQRIRLIVGLLDGWQGPLSWGAFLDLVHERLGVSYTRQALHKHTRIQQAFAHRKNTHREAAHPQKPTEVQVLLDRVDRLRRENERLKLENDRLLEQYARWAYNAHTHGLGPPELDRPLPPIDRA
jgi:hypothetical protein